MAKRARDEGFDVAALPEIRKRLKGIQILHTHTGHAQTLAWTASIGLRLKRIATRHVAFAPAYPLVHRLKYAGLCDGMIAVSEAVRSTEVAAGISSDRIEIIPTGVEIRELPDAAQRAAARNAWGLDPGDFAIGHLGAFTEEKGQDLAAHAFRLLEPRMPNLRMILAGEGSLRGAIGASLPSDSRLVLPGHIEDPAQLLAALDLFIMPSRSEGWGLAALEAMAAGLPVIAFNTGGLAEMIDPGATGWLISPTGAEALAEAIDSAAGNRDQLRVMGLLAQSRARRFSVEETARRTEEFYLRILNES